MQTEKVVGQGSLWWFLGLSFALSWGLNLPRVLSSAGVFALAPGLSFAMGLLAGLGPSLAAFALVLQREGRTGAARLWKRGWQGGFDRRWLLPILLLMPVQAGVTVLIMTLAGIPIAWEYGLPPAMIVPIGLLIMIGNGMGEEYGWRGYALDLLQQRWTALTAGLILGVAWGLWHLPLHFIEGSTQAAIPVWQFLIQTLALSVLYTWLHNNTGGSVLVAVLFHTVGNLSAATVPTWTSNAGRLIGFAVLALATVTVVSLWGPKKLTGQGASARAPARPPER